MAHERSRAGHGLGRRADLGVGHAEEDRATAAGHLAAAHAAPPRRAPRRAARRPGRFPRRPAPTTPTGASVSVFMAGLHWLAGPLLAEVAADASRIPSTASYVAPRLPRMQSRSAAERREELVALYKEVAACERCPLVRHPDPGGVRGRQRRRGPDVRRRGARAAGGSPGPALRGPGGQAARRAAGGRGPVPRRGVHHQRPEVAPARQPRPPARRDRGLPALPRPPDRADRADGDLHARKLRHQAADPLEPRDHGGSGAPPGARDRRRARCASIRSTTPRPRCARTRVLEELRADFAGLPGLLDEPPPVPLGAVGPVAPAPPRPSRGLSWTCSDSAPWSSRVPIRARRRPPARRSRAA